MGLSLRVSKDKCSAHGWFEPGERSRSVKQGAGLVLEAVPLAALERQADTSKHNTIQVRRFHGVLGGLRSDVGPTPQLCSSCIPDAQYLFKIYINVKDVVYLGLVSVQSTLGATHYKSVGRLATRKVFGKISPNTLRRTKVYCVTVARQSSFAVT
jgi:hypothetical protein